MQPRTTPRVAFALLTALCTLALSACGDEPVVDGVDAGAGDAGSTEAMDAGRDAGRARECEGIAAPCSTFDLDTCDTVPGCGASQCVGSPVACGRYASAGECDGTAGCRWTDSGCTGTATACVDVAGEEACRAQQGCTWSGAVTCSGTAPRCETLPRDECTTQPGCVVIEVDAGRIDGGPRDSGPSNWDGGGVCITPEGPSTHAGCNPVDGVECDGDWSDRCSPACSADQCCSPQRNSMTCVPRNPDGTCPAADLWVDDTRVNPQFDYEYFPEGDCAIVEGCVGGPGVRRLLRFDTWTPNTGTADMFLGVPSASVPYFEYSPCHGHYHFNSYAEYELLTSDGTCVAAEGHKQAFCLLDFYDYPCDDDRSDPAVPDCASIRGYTCGNQGIRRDAQDVYGGHLDCQWIDITDVPEGDYSMRVRINTEHILLETDYANNEVLVPVTIPAPPADVDVTTACPSRRSGAERDCGWTLEGERTCTPGTTVTVGCSAACGLGSCTDDPVLRVCDAAVGSHCTLRHALGLNDDSGCGSGACGRGGDCCAQLEITCPDSGTYNVFTGASDSTRAATCTVAAAP
ncbi:MAG: lysyl oxidase family protein [Myxococcota bacterium]|nr:lysyl oxidase family protein [Myxococcota bacterium]